MRTIIARTIYDTETAELVCERVWYTTHPNCQADKLKHRRALYRTKKGGLFGYRLDTIGYGRDERGITGAFQRIDRAIVAPFIDDGEVADWLEENGFAASDIEAAVPEAVEEA